MEELETRWPGTGSGPAEPARRVRHGTPTARATPSCVLEPRPAARRVPGASPGGRTTRTQACVRGRPRPLLRRAPARTPVERALVGIATTLCSAAVVVALGLVADLRGTDPVDGSGVGVPGPPTIVAPERVVP